LVTIIVIVISNIYVVWFVKQELYEKIEKHQFRGGGGFESRAGRSVYR
jgi:hypothetical protein